ncbi:MAG: histidinol-phosphatase [Desulfosporosinus sp.]|nr:histidinol-phosphatase [Desulfosporosinus sp.]
MIDIHSHILPGVDDGSKSMAETIEIVRQLQEAGFKTIIATPHVLEGKDYLRSADIRAITDQVRFQVAAAEIQVKILPGAENYIFPDMAKWARDGKLMTLGDAGKYLLVELPLLEIPHYTDQVFFELQVLGLTPVLAHPERYKGLVEEPERVLDWAKKGILLQLDLRSLSGKYGPQAKGLAKRLLGSDLIHFMGSDAHRVSQREGAYGEELRSVQGIVGEKKFGEMTLLNPQRMLEGEVVQRIGEYCLMGVGREKKGKRGFWSRISKILC